jgi:hypothetical protein
MILWSVLLPFPDDCELPPSHIIRVNKTLPAKVQQDIENDEGCKCHPIPEVDAVCSQRVGCRSSPTAVLYGKQNSEQCEHWMREATNWHHNIINLRLSGTNTEAQSCQDDRVKPNACNDNLGGSQRTKALSPSHRNKCTYCYCLDRQSGFVREMFRCPHRRKPNCSQDC